MFTKFFSRNYSVVRNMNDQYNFHKILPQDKGASWLTSLHKTVNDDPIKKKFITNFDGSMYSYFDCETGRDILEDPLVKVERHSGGSFYWTVSNLSTIYKHGWNNWVNRK